MRSQIAQLGFDPAQRQARCPEPGIELFLNLPNLLFLFLDLRQKLFVVRLFFVLCNSGFLFLLGEFLLFVRGEPVGKVPQESAVPALVKEIEKLL